MSAEDYYRHLMTERGYVINYTDVETKPLVQQLKQLYPAQSDSKLDEIARASGPAEIFRPLLNDVLKNAPVKYRKDFPSIYVGEFPLKNLNARVVSAPDGGILILVNRGLEKCLYEWAKVVVELAFLDAEDRKDRTEAGQEIASKFKKSVRDYLTSGDLPAFPDYAQGDKRLMATVLAASACEFVIAHEYGHGILGHLKLPSIPEDAQPSQRPTTSNDEEMDADRVAQEILLNNLSGTVGKDRLLDVETQISGMFFCVRILETSYAYTESSNRNIDPVKYDNYLDIAVRHSMIEQEVRSRVDLASPDYDLLRAYARTLNKLFDASVFPNPTLKELKPEDRLRKKFWQAYKKNDRTEMRRLVTRDPAWFAQWASDTLLAAETLVKDSLQSSAADWTDGGWLDAADLFGLAITIDHLYRSAAHKEAVHEIGPRGRRLAETLFANANSAAKAGRSPDTAGVMRATAGKIQTRLADTFPEQARLLAAYAAFDNHEYAIAFQEFLPLAKAGNAEAQYKVGTMYRVGQGTIPDPVAAATWVQRSAAQGFSDAEDDLGTMYAKGDGVSRDYTKAFQLYRSSAAKGNMHARFNLAWMYEQGLGVAKNPSEAAKCYRLAADDGHSGAMANLGIAYAQGLGVPQDLTLAYLWLSLAVNSQSPPSSSDFQQVVALRDAIMQHLSESERTRAQNLFDEWNTKHSRHN
jgi:TPR repeat protein